MQRNPARAIILPIIFAFIVLKIIASFYVDYSWFANLGYAQLYLKPILAKLQIGLASFVLYFLLTFLMGYVGLQVFLKAEQEETPFRRNFRLHVVNNNEGYTEKDITPINRKKVMSIIALISLSISLFFALSATGNGWMKLLEFKNSTPFGVTDSVFHKDISFYVFKIPFLNFVADSLTVPLTLLLVASLITFPLTGLIKLNGNVFKKGTVFIPKSIRVFWAGLIGLLFLVTAMKKYISMFAIMYSQAGYVYGAGYTDIHVTVPILKIMIGLALACSIGGLLYSFVNDHRLVFLTIAAYVVVSIFGSAAESLIQYNVSNNEYVMEKPYIQEEIKFTQLAYKLNQIKVDDYPGTAEITPESIKNNKETIDNIRLNDPAPLKTVLSQNQGLRYYYRFNDIDIDRYILDGNYRQVLLSPREISENALTEKAGTFVNLAMRYTHGYGASATLANEIDESGYAKLIVRDIPPVSVKKGIEIQEPRIYYGELTNDERYGYVIGNSRAKEFDYPQGDNNVENSYKGSTGIQLSGLNKFFLSAYFDTFRLYLAQEITPESKLLMRRNIIDRVNTLMPYLSYDQDPYMVIAKDGKMYWIIDAYTYSDKFPYAAPIGDMNYIRNSVKVVVDPYNGSVNFYTFDKNDPVLKTVSKIFPGVFKDPKEMPSNLLEHIRYPEDLFNIQANVLLNFHVNNPSVFYNKEDTWDIAKRLQSGEASTLKPFYSIMKLKGEDKAEFTLMLPFTPASRNEQHRNNLVAWLAARNDGEHYGELVLYKVPKNVEVQGPLMIDGLIDQDPNISGKMTLWGQGGSEIIRGNLLSVPIDNGFVYVEPIYIKAQQQGASIPQMQAIVFAIDKKIVMVETKDLNTAIAEFFSREGLKYGQRGNEKTGVQTPVKVNPKENILKQIELLKQQIESLEQQVKNL